MRTRPLGRTGLMVSEFALGTWGLSGDASGPVPEAEALRVLERALEIGITLFDTSDAYGAGRMEKLLGEATSSHERDGLIVVTKLGTDRGSSPPRKRFDAAYLREAVERSLNRLGRDRLDIVLLHNPSAVALAHGEAFGCMADLAREGKVGSFGASVGTAPVARAALEAGAQVLSLPYNLFQSADLHAVSGDVMVAGAGVLAHSVLAYGLLAGVWPKDKRFDESDHRAIRWTPSELAGRIEQLDAIRFLVKGNVRSLRGAAVRYALSSHLVSAAILGARSVTQLEDLVRETGGGPIYLSDSDLAALPRALARVGVAV